MISYIKGELSEILPDVIVVEANGIGYNIYVPGSVLGELPSVGSEVKSRKMNAVCSDSLQEMI